MAFIDRDQGHVGVVVGFAAAFVGALVLALLLIPLQAGVVHVATGSMALVALALPAVAVAATVWTGAQPGVPGAARIAVVLVIVLAATMIGAAVIWTSATVLYLPDRRLLHPLPVDGPAMWTAAIGSAVVLVAAAGRRWRTGGTPGWLRVGFVFTSIYAVALGAWLALYAELGSYPHHTELLTMDPDGADMRRILAMLVGPPLVPAVLAMLLVGRRGRVARALVRVGAPGLVAAVVLAVLAAATPHTHDGAHEEYLLRDAAPLLMAAICLCVAHALAIGVAHLRSLAAERAQPAPWRQVGVIEVDGVDPAVGHLVDHGWLAGGAATARGFTLRTAHGALPVPAGAAVIAPVPVAAITAPIGAPHTVLWSGLEVEVTGFVAGGADGYRSSSRPMPGTHGMVVRVPRTDARVGEFLARVWRPALAALVATMLAAAPELVSLGATGGDDDGLYERAAAPTPEDRGMPELRRPGATRD